MTGRPRPSADRRTSAGALRHAGLQRLLDRIARQGDSRFALRLPDGDELVSDGAGAPRFTLVVRNPSVLTAAALRRHVGLIEAYCDGALDLEGDLAAAFATGLRARLDGTPGPLGRLESLLHEWGRSGRSVGRARANARAHYGLPEAFYRLWLDDPLKVYSCAYWCDGVRTLEEAQQRKIEHVCRKIRLGPQDRFIDVGCGFGGFLLHAARSTGARGVGLNATPEQVAWLQDEIACQGLAGRIEVRLGDFRDIGQTHDKLVSIGVLEHAGRDQLGAALRGHARALAPGGLGLLHFIGHVGRGETDLFIRKHVFPGGWIPALADVLVELERCGLEVLDVENLRRHYALTLDEWARRFEARWPDIRALDPARFDERFRRLWRSYLVGCAETFRAPNGRTHLFQVTFSKGHVTPQSYPMDRGFLYR